MKALSRAMREGSYPDGHTWNDSSIFMSAADNDVTFYADVNNDGIPDLVHFWLDTSTNSVVSTIPLGAVWPTGIAITPNGAFAYVANASSTSVSIIDTMTTLSRPKFRCAMTLSTTIWLKTGMSIDRPAATRARTPAQASIRR